MVATTMSTRLHKMCWSSLSECLSCPPALHHCVTVSLHEWMSEWMSEWVQRHWGKHCRRRRRMQCWKVQWKVHQSGLVQALCLSLSLSLCVSLCVCVCELRWVVITPKHIYEVWTRTKSTSPFLLLLLLLKVHNVCVPLCLSICLCLSIYLWGLFEKKRSLWLSLCISQHMSLCWKEIEVVEKSCVELTVRSNRNVLVEEKWRCVGKKEECLLKSNRNVFVLVVVVVAKQYKCFFVWVSEWVSWEERKKSVWLCLKLFSSLHFTVLCFLHNTSTSTSLPHTHTDRHIQIHEWMNTNTDIYKYILTYTNTRIHEQIN